MRRTAVPLSVLAALMLVIPVAGIPVAQSSVQPRGGDNQTALAAVFAASPGAGALRAMQLQASSAAAASMPANVSSPPSRTYTIQPGDNLWDIAQRHNVTAETLATANRLTPTSILQPGRTLSLPSGEPQGAAPAPRQAKPVQTARAGSTAVNHIVQTGETLWEISKTYGTTVEALMAVNDLGDSDRIKPGQRLMVSSRSLPRYRQIPPLADGRAPSPEPALDESILKRVEGLSWPSRGVLTSRFGWRYRRHHDGIDLAAPWGTAIQAAHGGLVVFAGWHGGYGNVVFVAHGDGVITVYGHASKLLVKIGDQVTQGQVIAQVGCTGACTGSHVHFEVRVNGHAIDPLKFLQ